MGHMMVYEGIKERLGLQGNHSTHVEHRGL